MIRGIQVKRNEKEWKVIPESFAKESKAKEKLQAVREFGRDQRNEEWNDENEETESLLLRLVPVECKKREKEEWSDEENKDKER